MPTHEVFESLYACPTCGATASESNIERHRAWHEMLDKALEDITEPAEIRIRPWPADEPAGFEPAGSPSSPYSPDVR